MFSGDALIGLVSALDPILKLIAHWRQSREHTECVAGISQISSARIECDSLPDLIKVSMPDLGRLSLSHD
jgi:hypothetical protein